jgi:uncharacterized membrane protein
MTQKTSSETCCSESNQVFKKIKAFLKEWYVRHMIVKNSKGSVIIELPVLLAVIAAIIAPVVAVVCAVVAIATDCSLVVENYPEAKK